MKKLILLFLISCAKKPRAALPPVESPVVNFELLLQNRLSCIELESWDEKTAYGLSTGKQKVALFIKGKVYDYNMVTNIITPYPDGEIQIGSFCLVEVKNSVIKNVIYLPVET